MKIEDIARNRRLRDGMKEKEIDALLDELREEKINPRVYYYPAELALYSKVTVPTILRYCEQKKIKYKKI